VTPPPQPAYLRWLRELRRAAAWHRRLLTAGLLAAAVAFGLQATSPSPPPGTRVLVAARDLAGGQPPSLADVDVREVPAASVPAGALHRAADLDGRTLAGPVRAGEILTDVRLVGRTLLEAYGDTLVAAPVRIADADSVRLVRPGDVVDVLAAGGQPGAPGEARLVASEVQVLTVPTVPRDALGVHDPTAGALVMVVTTDATAARLAGAAASQRLSLVLR
jgi:pilus assembly protein CpaB